MPTQPETASSQALVTQTLQKKLPYFILGVVVVILVIGAASSLLLAKLPTHSTSKSMTKTNTNTKKHPNDKGQISATMTGEVTNTGTEYIVKDGDSLSSIAAQVYGDPNAWQRIANANNLQDSNDLNPGMKLTIPR